MPLHVLLIDDDVHSLTRASACLRAVLPRRQSLTLTVTTSWHTAKVRIVLEAFDVIVLRQDVCDADAVTMLEALRGLPHPPVIVLTRDADLDTALRVLRAGADDCVMQHLVDWPVELRLAIDRLAVPARRRGESAEASGGATQYAAVLAALLLRRQTPRTPWIGASTHAA